MIDRVTEDALSLPTENRLILVEKLLRSLNLPICEDIDRLWAEEAELRISQIDSGKAKLVPGEEVFAKIKEKYKK
jgi:hypothetical protein